MTTTINPDDLHRRMADGGDVTLIDVRSGSEFENGHIAGAYNVPVDALGEHRAELSRVQREVVLVCQSGARATKAEAMLTEAGLENVHVLVGGMNAWQASSRPVRQVRQRWTLERQVRLSAGLIVLAAVLASLAVPALVWIAALVGAGLTVAALTNTCAMGALLARLPYNRASQCNLDNVVSQLLGKDSR